MKIYLSRHMSGFTSNHLIHWYKEKELILKSLGYEVLSPMTDALNIEGEYAPLCNSKDPSGSQHAVFTRDKFMLKNSDIVLLVLTDYNIDKASIGCVCELAWSHLLGKHTIVCTDSTIYNHTFVLESADVVFNCWEDTCLYLRRLKDWRMK